MKSLCSPTTLLRIIALCCLHSTTAQEAPAQAALYQKPPVQNTSAPKSITQEALASNPTPQKRLASKPAPQKRPASKPAGFVYYDADRLYDTLPALFYDDMDYTPEGRLRWTSDRYRRKIVQTAALLDSMGMELVALAGVETEAVVRDLIAACREEYCYLHRTLNGFDGLDIALLYHGDRFWPTGAREGRGWLYIKGELDGTPIIVLLCSNGRYATEALTDCREEHPDTPLIAAGRFSAEEAPCHGMIDALARAEAAGRGNIHYRTGWRMAERILCDTTLHALSGDVYARHWLMDLQLGAPRPTYQRNAYKGGHSRTLPVFVYFAPPTRKE